MNNEQRAKSYSNASHQEIFHITSHLLFSFIHVNAIAFLQALTMRRSKGSPPSKFMFSVNCFALRLTIFGLRANLVLKENASNSSHPFRYPADQQQTDARVRSRGRLSAESAAIAPVLRAEAIKLFSSFFQNGPHCRWPENRPSVSLSDHVPLTCPSLSLWPCHTAPSDAPPTVKAIFPFSEVVPTVS